MVDMWECGCHTTGKWRVLRVFPQGVHPNNPVRQAVKARHLERDEFRFSHVEAVGADHHDRATDRPTAPVIEESAEGKADSCSTVPVDGRVRGICERLVDISSTKHTRETSETSTKRKDLPALVGCQGRVPEDQQGTRERRHRARDIEDEHKAPAAFTTGAVRELNRLTSGSQGQPQRSTHVSLTARRCPASPRAPHRCGELEAGHKTGDRLKLVATHPRKAPNANRLVRAGKGGLRSLTRKERFPPVFGVSGRPAQTKRRS